MTNWQEIADKILTRVLEEWRRQGHNLTSKVEESARTTVEQTVGFLRITGELLYYARFVNTGVAASAIPYSPPTGRGGTSKYIQGLIAYARARGMENPKSAAFAIAAKHKKEGMPTAGSRVFSQTGKRTEFVEEAFKQAIPELDKLVLEMAGKELDDRMTKALIEIQN